MLTDCQEITVNAVRFPHQTGTVFYTCSPCDRANRTADKIHLVSILLEHLAGTEGALWTNTIQIVPDQLGRPQLLLGECDGPTISFSEGGGRMWAALCTDNFDIGIDAAGADEFSNEYPFNRVFHGQELHHTLNLTEGDLQKASALLWSIKEAAVKSLGCAFHLVDPLEVRVNPSAAEKDGWHTFTVCLSGKALERFPVTGLCIEVRSRVLGQMWLSVALLEN